EAQSCGKASSWADKLKKGQRHPWKNSLARLEQQVLRGFQQKRSSPLLPFPRRAALKAQEQLLHQTRAQSTAPIISFLILSRDRPDLLIPCIKSIEKYCNVPFEILVGDTGSTDYDTLCFYQSTPHQIINLGFYHYSICNNILAANAKGPWLVL